MIKKVLTSFVETNEKKFKKRYILKKKGKKRMKLKNLKIVS